ncbi:TauD/TfdA dioxygenase family protein [Ascoidea rubescens DSM 1968]|uniref:Taurine catabolism dioxygenase n=1 Tax=Ascoidea rubescens DSM 1968 TaxID=1344418 RepID=A0A1D2VKY7_9ASCO|nr:taurine catabolism dioxygenase [Ascoidea rubescens DSM 1968]ODV62255.1 taurine catabolism dioxygenase [Ascoidea rubescens DSM 1968]
MSQTITLENTEPQDVRIKAPAIDQQIEAIIKTEFKSAYVHSQSLLPKDVPNGSDPEGLKRLPESTRKRFDDAGIDISKGYPHVPNKKDIPIFLDEAFEIRNKEFPYIERGLNADPEKKALFGAAKQVINLTKKIGTEIVGLQLSDLNDKQKDELALLVAERVVTPRVPNLDGVIVIWQDYRFNTLTYKNNNYGNFGKFGGFGTQTWHTDLVHEFQPAGITHLHNDAIPELGGDTIWSSEYAAYDKLSPALQKFLDGKEAIYVSAHGYLDRDDPFSGPKKVERRHPIVRTHPATGWKALFVNRSMTKSIVGLEPPESDVILNYLFSVFEKNADIQVRFNWKSTKPGYGTSAIWDNRISIHSTVWDHEGLEPRHGTRVTSLAEVPFFDSKSKSQREALGLPLN